VILKSLYRSSLKYKATGIIQQRVSISVEKKRKLRRAHNIIKEQKLNQMKGSINDRLSIVFLILLVDQVCLKTTRMSKRVLEQKTD